MRRGLIAHSRTELPDFVLESRLKRLRAAMAEAGLDALIAYTNNTRPAAVSWLTGFVPYWSEALLLLGREGRPVLVVALTNRVKTWIEATSYGAEVTHFPRIGLEAAKRLTAQKRDAVLGLVEFATLPAGLVADLRAAGPGLVLRDATDLFAALRGKADPAEIALAGKAARLAHQALAQAMPQASLGDTVAAVERYARLLGAEEIYVAAAPDLARDRHLRRLEGEVRRGGSYALRATLAYKGSWVRLTRTLGIDEKLRRQTAENFAAAVALLPDERGLAAFSSFLVEGCRLAQPLEPFIGTGLDRRVALLPGALVSVQATLEIDGQPILIGGPALIGGPGEGASLLGDGEFEIAA